MAHPKRKHSRARTRKKRTHQKVSTPKLVKCDHCQKLKPAHMVCPFCGYYKQQQIVNVEPKQKKKKK